MRLHSLQASLSTDAALIEDPTNLFYLTGLSLSKGLLALTKQDTALFVDGRYFGHAKQKSPCPVLLWEGDAPFAWLQERGCNSLAFDSATSSYDQFLLLQKKGPERLVPVSGLLKKQRAVKSKEELAALQKAADVTWAGYRHLLPLLREGVSEEEIALAFEIEVRKKGASGMAFDPIIAFGENSAYPHHRAGSTKLQRDQIVLIDVGATVNHYQGDLTRIYFFGAPSSELVSMLELTRQAQEAAFQAVRPGQTWGALDQAARSVLAAQGKEELFTHGLGHGIGLETHEFPSIKIIGPDRNERLEAGMVFTLEPGLYRVGLGGVRWEDMVVVTEAGVRRLYPNGP